MHSAVGMPAVLVVLVDLSQHQAVVVASQRACQWLRFSVPLHDHLVRRARVAARASIELRQAAHRKVPLPRRVDDPARVKRLLVEELPGTQPYLLVRHHPRRVVTMSGL